MIALVNLSTLMQKYLSIIWKINRFDKRQVGRCRNASKSARVTDSSSKRSRRVLWAFLTQIPIAQYISGM